VLTTQQIRDVGEAIAVYQPLPAAKAFHPSRKPIRWLFGGNRASKSTTNIGFDMCSFALGVHPVRKTPKNAVIWACTANWAMVGKILWREKVRTYLPSNQIAGVVWHNKNADIPREIQLKNGNVIEFKAYEQGRVAFQGRAIDAFYGDEQCEHDSEGIWQEIQARLIDRHGFSAQSMTPIIPQPWLQERVANAPDTDEVVYANLNDNRKSRGGHIDDEQIDGLIAEWPQEVQETRIAGKFAAFMGVVYKAFRRDTHVAEPFGIPRDWQRFRAIDFGFNNPFCCLWLARDPDRNWTVYAEHYQAQESLAYHAERIHALSGDERYVATWADHDAQDRHELHDKGIYTLPAKKDIRLGIEVVQAALKVQGNGRPRLQIFSCCKNLVREMTTYRWPEGTEARDPQDKPIPKDDHAADSLRYCLLSVEGDSYFHRRPT
jgi:terminase large subunit-like protein